jgi:hypothetical protein
LFVLLNGLVHVLRKRCARRRNDFDWSCNTFWNTSRQNFHGVVEIFWSEVGVTHCHLQGGVTHEFVHGENGDARLHEPRGKRVPIVVPPMTIVVRRGLAMFCELRGDVLRCERPGGTPLEPLAYNPVAIWAEALAGIGELVVFARAGNRIFNDLVNRELTTLGKIPAVAARRAADEPAHSVLYHNLYH